MLKRNMLREIQEEEEEEESAAQRARSGPKQPAAAPSISIFMDMESFPHPELCQAFSIVMENSFLDAAKEARDPDVLLASSVCQGDYYKVGFFNDRAVFKQFEVQFPMTTALYLWFAMYGEEQGGWLVSDKLWDSEATHKDVQMFMWFEGDSTLPGAPHLPYWAKEATKGILADQTVIMQAMFLEENRLELVRRREEGMSSNHRL